MKRNLPLFLICFLCVTGISAVSAQSVSYTPVVASAVADAGGNKLASGYITFTPVDNSGNPLSARGVISRAVKCFVVAGAITTQPGGGTCQVADALASNPNLCYKVSLWDSVQKSPIPTPGQSCAQPTGSSPWSYDSYVPNETPATLVQSGPAGVNWRGTWSGSASYNLNDGVTYGGSSYVSLVGGNTSTPPGSSWELLAQAGTGSIAGLSGDGAGDASLTGRFSAAAVNNVYDADSSIAADCGAAIDTEDAAIGSSTPALIQFSQSCAGAVFSTAVTPAAGHDLQIVQPGTYTMNSYIAAPISATAGKVQKWSFRGVPGAVLSKGSITPPAGNWSINPVIVAKGTLGASSLLTANVAEGATAIDVSSTASFPSSGSFWGVVSDASGAPIASGTYTNGLSVTGTSGQTCALQINGMAGAYVSVALTGTNTIAGGTALTIYSAGTQATGGTPTTAAAVSSFTGFTPTATCTGTANVSLTLLGGCYWGAQSNQSCHQEMVEVLSVGPAGQLNLTHSLGKGYTTAANATFTIVTPASVDIEDVQINAGSDTGPAIELAYCVGCRLRNVGAGGGGQQYSQGVLVFTADHLEISGSVERDNQGLHASGSSQFPLNLAGCQECDIHNVYFRDAGEAMAFTSESMHSRASDFICDGTGDSCANDHGGANFDITFQGFASHGPAAYSCPLTSIARSSNVVTGVCAFPPAIYTGQTFNVAGVSGDTSFNGTGFTVASISGNTVTWSQTGSNSTGTGGTLAVNVAARGIVACNGTSGAPDWDIRILDGSVDNYFQSAVLVDGNPYYSGTQSCRNVTVSHVIASDPQPAPSGTPGNYFGSVEAIYAKSVFLDDVHVRKVACGQSGFQLQGVDTFSIIGSSVAQENAGCPGGASTTFGLFLYGGDSAKVTNGVVALSSFNGTDSYPIYVSAQNSGDTNNLQFALVDGLNQAGSATYYFGANATNVCRILMGDGTNSLCGQNIANVGNLNGVAPGAIALPSSTTAADSTTTSGASTGANLQWDANAPSNSSGAYEALQAQFETLGIYNYTGSGYGAVFSAGHYGTGTAAFLAGAYSYASNRAGGTLSEAAAHSFFVFNPASGNLTMGESLDLLTPTNTGGGTFGTYRGIYQHSLASCGTSGYPAACYFLALDNGSGGYSYRVDGLGNVTATSFTGSGSGLTGVAKMLYVAGPASAITGNGSEQAYYTYTLPGGTMGANSCVEIECSFTKTGSDSSNYWIKFGTGNYVAATGSTATAGNGSQTAMVCNNGSASSQWARGTKQQIATSAYAPQFYTYSVATASNVTVTCSESVLPSTSSITPEGITVKLWY